VRDHVSQLSRTLCRELGATKGNLKDRLVELGEVGQIDQKLLAWADELRLIGNDAAHDLDVMIERVDARDALDFETSQKPSDL